MLFWYPCRQGRIGSKEWLFKVSSNYCHIKISFNIGWTICMALTIVLGIHIVRWIVAQNGWYNIMALSHAYADDINERVKVTELWCLYSVRIERFIKKGVFFMECKVRYCVNYYMHLALMYILMLIITCLCECQANRPHFLSCSWRCKEERDWVHKQRRLLLMSMTISRKMTGINGHKYLWNEPLMP